MLVNREIGLVYDIGLCVSLVYECSVSVTAVTLNVVDVTVQRPSSERGQPQELLQEGKIPPFLPSLFYSLPMLLSHPSLPLFLPSPFCCSLSRVKRPLKSS